MEMVGWSGLSMQQTPTGRYCGRKNNNISHLKGLQRTTPDGLGTLTSKCCTGALCLSPALFLFLWLSSATLSTNEIFCGSFLTENLVIFVPAKKAKWILLRNHSNRNIVGGNHNVLLHYVNVSAPNPGPIWCCPQQPFQMRYFVVHF